MIKLGTHQNLKEPYKEHNSWTLLQLLCQR